MAFDDLREFLAAIEREGELLRVRAEVDPVLEIGAIADRAAKGGGPALLFERPKGSRVPVLINQFASMKRMAMALGVSSLDDLSKNLENLIEKDPPASLWESLKHLPEFARLARIFPRKVDDAPCQEVVKTGPQARIDDLPVITAWPGDAGPFVSLGCVFTRDPKTNRRNCGMYRLQVFDPQTLGFHSHRHHSGAEHARETPEGRKLPVAVAIGTDPAVTFSAVAPLPPGMDEMLLAGWLRGSGVAMVGCKTVPLEVPATAEIVLEGWVDPADVRTEGPYGDHTGFYSLADRYPTLRLSAVTHRRDPIYATTVVGAPPMEDGWIGYAIERLFLPLLRKIVPEVVDYHMPWEGAFHNLVLVSIKKRHPGQARKVMHALWGTGQAIFSKVVVVVDEWVDVRNPREAAWAALASIDPARDMEVAHGPAETLDHASRAVCYGSKVGFDATKKLPEEGFDRAWPEVQRHTPETTARVRARWAELGLGHLPFPEGLLGGGRIDS